MSDKTVAQSGLSQEYGEVSYLCPHDGTEWSTRAVMCEGNLDPAPLNDGDRCPRCRAECTQITDWNPDTPEGYRLWIEAPEVTQ
jgi:hypothetical protein